MDHSTVFQLSMFEIIDLEDLGQLLQKIALIWTNLSMPISQWTWMMRQIYLILLIWIWMIQMMISGRWKRYRSIHSSKGKHRSNAYCFIE